jgi:hypothetical protein
MRHLETGVRYLHDQVEPEPGGEDEHQSPVAQNREQMRAEHRTDDPGAQEQRQVLPPRFPGAAAVLPQQPAVRDEGRQHHHHDSALDADQRGQKRHRHHRQAEPGDALGHRADQQRREDDRGVPLRPPPPLPSPIKGEGAHCAVPFPLVGEG